MGDRVTSIAVLLLLALQSAPADRVRAVELARAGRNEEAVQLFERIVAQSPADTESRLWIARLDLRLGRIESAEAQVRSVLADHPADVDARIVLGTVLTRKGDWRGALDVLVPTEPDAGENGDFFAALARAHRRAGDDRNAYQSFRKAVALSPDDPELRAGYENAASAYGHAIAVEGFGQQVTPGSNSATGSLAVSIRATPSLHVLGLVRTRHGDGVSDALGGGGLQWHVARPTLLTLHGSGGSGNESLPRIDFGGDVVQYAGVFELGGGIRELSYDGVGVTALSATAAWDEGERWRFDTRYTYSRSRFDATDDATGDHSVVVRPTFRATRRVWFNGAYAYGIESFEDLTADRLGQLGSTTAAGGIRIGLRSLTVITTTWEHQWRSNDSTLDRLTVTLVQYFP
jgi:YaiO family outer membrane protein